MFKIYSKGCEYALRILTQIPSDQWGRKFLAAQLSRKAKVPLHSARKILQLLVEHEYLQAVSGPGGGYQFKKNPEEISLLELIQLIDGKNAFEHCAMGLPQCDSNNPCPLHGLWQNVKGEMVTAMSNKKLSELMSTVKKSKIS